MVRKLVVFPGAPNIYAPKGVVAPQAGGATGRSLAQLPAGEMAFGRLESLKSGALRGFQGNLSRRALIIGDARGMIGRSMLRWKECNAAPAPTARRAPSVASWGGRPVVNFSGRHPTPARTRRSALRLIRARPGGESWAHITRRIWRRRRATRNSAPVGKAMRNSGAFSRASAHTALLRWSRTG